MVAGEVGVEEVGDVVAHGGGACGAEEGAQVVVVADQEDERRGEPQGRGVVEEGPHEGLDAVAVVGVGIELDDVEPQLPLPGDERLQGLAETGARDDEHALRLVGDGKGAGAAGIEPHGEAGVERGVASQSVALGVVGRGAHREAEELPGAHGAEVVDVDGVAAAVPAAGRIYLFVSVVVGRRRVLAPRVGDGGQGCGGAEGERVLALDGGDLEAAAFGEPDQGGGRGEGGGADAAGGEVHALADQHGVRRVGGAQAEAAGPLEAEQQQAVALGRQRQRRLCADLSRSKKAV